MSDETGAKNEKNGKIDELFVVARDSMQSNGNSIIEGLFRTIGNSLLRADDNIVGAMYYVADRINAASLDIFLTAGRGNLQKADEMALAYCKNNYSQAAAAAGNCEFTGKLPDGWPDKDRFYYQLPQVFQHDYEKRPLEVAVVLYLAQHPSIDPVAPASLTDEEIKEITKLAKEALALYKRGEESDTFKQSNGEVNYTNIFAGFIYAVTLKQTQDTKTRAPQKFISSVDKVSNVVFDKKLNGNLYSPTPYPLAVEKRGSKKQIDTMVRLDYTLIDKNGVHVEYKKVLTPYDREVNDAITTLSVEGHNEYITHSMIYQTMVGNPNATLNVKQEEEIRNSETKLMYTPLYIDAKEEAKAYGADHYGVYESTIISAERVKDVRLNGTVVSECLHLFRTPALYDYASKRNQIGRLSIKLLNSPINKRKETIILQGYLFRRILSMKSPKSNQSPNIVYETLYEQLEITAKNDGALRKKKAKIRSQVKTILDYWKSERFISGYSENTKGKEIYSLTIKV